MGVRPRDLVARGVVQNGQSSTLNTSRHGHPAHFAQWGTGGVGGAWCARITPRAARVPPPRREPSASLFGVAHVVWTRAGDL